MSGFNNEKLKAIAHQAMAQMVFYYRSDIVYFLNFSACKMHFQNHGQVPAGYLEKKPGSFPTFVSEFRVARNVVENEDKTHMHKLLDSTLRWVTEGNYGDPNEFATHLGKNGITHDGKHMVSLASKLLFLNDPIKNQPLDALAKAALKIRGNNDYAAFKIEADKFKEDHIDLITWPLKEYDSVLRKIEDEFSEYEVHPWGELREMRFLDKVLWTMGWNMGKKNEIKLFQQS